MRSLPSAGTAPRHTRGSVVRRSVAAVALLGLLVTGGCADKGPKLAKPSGTTTAPALTSAGAAPASALPAGTRYVAQAVGPHVDVYDQPDPTTPVKITLDNPNENGAPLVFLVIEQKGQWIHVNLPIRPNGSSGWIQSSTVSLSTDPYKVVVQLGAHRLKLYENDTKLVLDVPIGVGTQDTPTPGGVFYIKELLQPPDPNGAYGPYAYGLSGFSEKEELANFAGGTGVIGIHGTNQPDLVGKDVSHGCIRLNNDDIQKLVQLLPLGTPVDIQA